MLKNDIEMEGSSPKGTVLLSGGSSGIGAAASMMLAEKGFRVYALSRRGTAPVHPLIVPVKADINDESAVKEAVATIIRKEGKIDILVCNAGNGIAGSIEDIPVQDAKGQFETCYFGALSLIREVLPFMREKRSGKIITVASVAAVIPLPFQAHYSAVKSATLSMTEALSLEVKPFGIQCSCILPGDARTGFTAARKTFGKEDGPYSEKLKSSVSKMEKDEQQGMSPEKIASQIVKQATSRHLKPVVTPGLQYKAVNMLYAILPRRLALKIIGMLYA
ncbi:MAG: SDR family oxidoreductase [Bacteroidales bacterium]|nr:SDR family oxidoreductase [Bacteroidales bacterium]